ncbi:unnamed protein product [Gordionus sp. m RMFG-2023]
MKDFFDEHINYQIVEIDIPLLSEHKLWNKNSEDWPILSKLDYYHYKNKDKCKKTELKNFKIKSSLLQNYHNIISDLHSSPQDDTYENIISKDGEKIEDLLAFSEFQLELSSLIWSYKDVYYPLRNVSNCEEIREIYCLHALNHAIKTRDLIIRNNTKLEKTNFSQNIEEKDFRDRGFTRPKILILVPFKNSAFRIVHTMMTLMSSTFTQKSLVTNKHRFYQEYSDLDQNAEIKYPSKDRKELFSGNVDDCFKLGLSISKKCLKLYTDFYSSDIIICSPLGLKTLGSSAKKIVTNKHLEDLNKGIINEKDIYNKELADETLDFLSSIEILIMEQTDTFMMQNWSHVLYLVKMMNKRPIKAHDADFSRVRDWYLNGLAKHYRQTIILSRVNSPQINSLFHAYCQNHEGKVMIMEPCTRGILDGIKSSITHIGLNAQNASSLVDARFTFFTEKILVQRILEGNRRYARRTLLFIPSYFDFVRIRNYLIEREIGFFSITEYDDEKHVRKVRKAIKIFESSYQNQQNASANIKSTPCHDISVTIDKTLLILNTERSYFFRKPRFQCVYECLFYELPTYPDYYLDLYNDCIVSGNSNVNKTPSSFDNSHIVSQNIRDSLQKMTVLYDCKFDWLKISALLGINRAKHMVLNSMDNIKRRKHDSFNGKINDVSFENIGNEIGVESIVFITGA